MNRRSFLFGLAAAPMATKAVAPVTPPVRFESFGDGVAVRLHGPQPVAPEIGWTDFSGGRKVYVRGPGKLTIR